MKKTDMFLHIDNINSAFTAKRDKDFSFMGESHSVWEMVYVLDGEVGIMAGNKIFHLTKGEIIFHKPYEFHRIWSYNNSSPTYFVVSFELSGTNTDFFKNLTLKVNNKQHELLSILVNFTRNNPVNKQYELDYSGETEPDFSCFVYILDLLLCLFAKDSTFIEENKSESALIFKKVVEYMENNLNKNISVYEFSKIANVSSSTLKRIFHRYASINVHSYFLQLKINRAKDLLKNGASVYGVSKQLGFTNQNNFSSTFKKMVGLPPSLYKSK